VAPVSPGGLFIGVMSGTSVDGADAVLADFSEATPRALSFASVAFEGDLRERILALCAPGRDSLDLAGSVTVDLAQVYAGAVEQVLANAGLSAGNVRAIGCHGQTVRHRPERGFTIQLNDAARLAELTQIDVVADFRSRDVAAGGQGAPLVPAFHEAVFRSRGVARAIVNIGGIANVTWLPGTGPILGFDCGPGNVLMDAWTQRHLQKTFDEGGQWASTGRFDARLLEGVLAEPYLGHGAAEEHRTRAFRPVLARPADSRRDGTGRCPGDPRRVHGGVAHRLRSIASVHPPTRSSWRAEAPATRSSFHASVRRPGRGASKRPMRSAYPAGMSSPSPSRGSQ
jgi:1,6-anhydro-N-acetylmuramate kinase